jgi:hypothetical protein
MLTVQSRRPNGGSVVLARAIQSTFLLYALTLLVREVVNPASLWWQFSGGELRRALSDTLPWLGTIFAASYVSLYSRFSSQWSYLAGLYNQIKAAEINSVATGRTGVSTKLAEWKAAFIEDADDLHLSTKPIFASVIRRWSEDSEVQRAFEHFGVGKGPRFNAIKEAAIRACQHHEKELITISGKGEITL